MDVFRFLITAVKPKSRIGRIGFYTGSGLTAFATFYLPYVYYKRRSEEKYRLTVCWDEYAEYSKLLVLNRAVGTEIVSSHYRRYHECIKNAKAGLIYSST